MSLLRVIDVSEALPLPASLRCATRTRQLVVCALNAMERGDAISAMLYLNSALHTDTTQLVRPKTAARVLAALLAGGPGRRLRMRVRGRRRWAGGAEGCLPPLAAGPTDEMATCTAYTEGWG